MVERLATGFVWAMYAYAAIGVIFAIFFALWGVQKMDTQAQGSGVGFRLLLIPGIAAFWPLFARRWMRATGDSPVERNPHR
jgi:hypothetical protein